MKKRSRILFLGAASSLALAYLVLTGYLVSQVRPLPITFVPASPE